MVHELSPPKLGMQKFLPWRSLVRLFKLCRVAVGYPRAALPSHWRCKCRGGTVRLYKRAQIFVGDVWGAFQVPPSPPCAQLCL